MPRSDPRHICGTISSLQDAAKRLARGEDGSGDSAPITVDGALKDYRRDLEARNANPYNPEIAARASDEGAARQAGERLNAHELKKWRDGLLGKIAPATINRVCRCRGDLNCGFARRLPRSDADTVHSYSLTGRSSARTAVILAVQPPPIVFSTETRKHSAKSSDFTSLLSTCRRISAFPQGCVKPLARDVPILFRQLPNGAAENASSIVMLAGDFANSSIIRFRPMISSPAPRHSRRSVAHAAAARGARCRHCAR